MKPLDQMFKWTFNLFIFLLCFQFGFILFAYGVLHKAKKEQKEKEAKVAFSCGDFDNESSYFPLANDGENLRSCLHEECPESMWIHKGAQSQTKDLHVISAKEPQPKDDVVNGHTIKVGLSRNTKPYTLVLAAQKDLTLWDLQGYEEGSHLEKVIILSRGLSWVEGLPENFPIEYFSQETICNFPLAWQELENPNNEFRRLARALKSYTGLDITTFQGKAVAGLFALPPEVSKRGLASVPERVPASDTSFSAPPGLRWERVDKRVMPQTFTYAAADGAQEVSIPSSTLDAVYDTQEQKIYVLDRYRFGTWNPSQKTFQKISLPLELPNMHWPSSMALNTKDREILVYNDERGGEVYLFSIDKKTWTRVASGVGYTLSGVTYSPVDNAYYATRVSGQKITEILKINSGGKIQATRALETPYDYSKSLWRQRLVTKPGRLWLQVFHPARPEGETYPLNDIKASL